MSVKDKLFLLGVVLLVAVGFLGHHYCACAIAVLQHLIAVAIVPAVASAAQLL
jgi:hypothetical protein